ncbi:MAG: hypothetical protein IJA22_03000 [Clostridia bacterium]|nr:hypothetical protein [Clostridia bacterium]
MKKFEKLKNFKNNVVKRTKEVAVNAGCRLDDWAHNTMVCTGYGAGAGAILGGATVIANNFLNVAISSSPLATFAFCTAVSAVGGLCLGGILDIANTEMVEEIYL